MALIGLTTVLRALRPETPACAPAGDSQELSTFSSTEDASRMACWQYVMTTPGCLMGLKIVL